MIVLSEMHLCTSRLILMCACMSYSNHACISGCDCVHDAAIMYRYMIIAACTHIYIRLHYAHICNNYVPVHACTHYTITFQMVAACTPTITHTAGTLLQHAHIRTSTWSVAAYTQAHTLGHGCIIMHTHKCTNTNWYMIACISLTIMSTFKDYKSPKP